MPDATPEPRVSHDATCRHGNPLHQDCFKCEESTEAVADKWRQVASDARATIASQATEIERLTAELAEVRSDLEDCQIDKAGWEIVLEERTAQLATAEAALKSAREALKAMLDEHAPADDAIRAGMEPPCNDMARAALTPPKEP